MTTLLDRLVARWLDLGLAYPNSVLWVRCVPVRAAWDREIGRRIDRRHGR